MGKGKKKKDKKGQVVNESLQEQEGISQDQQESESQQPWQKQEKKKKNSVKRQSTWGLPIPVEPEPPQGVWARPKEAHQLSCEAGAAAVSDGSAKSSEEIAVGGEEKGDNPAGGEGNEKADEESKEEIKKPSPPSAASSPEDTAVKSSGAKAGSSGDLEKKSFTEKEKNYWSSLIPVRKNPGKAGARGRNIEVFTNMVKIIFESKFKVSATHYDVKFSTNTPKLLKRLAFNKLREEKFPKNWPAFDGRANAYSVGDLPFGHSITHILQVADEEGYQDCAVTVTMEKVNVVDLSWLPRVSTGFKEKEKDQSSIQVLDVVLRSAPYARAIPIGRSFFQQPQSQPFDLDNGMELWVGMFQSAVLGWKPYFNVDVSHKSFPKSVSVLDAMKEQCGDPKKELTAEMVTKNFNKISKYLEGLKVVFQLPNKPSSKRTVGINGLGQPAKDAKFIIENGQQCTVANYFLRSKGYKLQRPDLPCLWVGSKKKKVLLPPELCTIPAGSITNKKLNDKQTIKMIKEAAKPASERMTSIESVLHSMNFNDNLTMREFGISLNGQLEKVDARVLEPPSLKYKDIKSLKVQKGVWRAGKFLTAQNIPDDSWTVLNLSSDCKEEEIRKFVSLLQNFGKDNGMIIGKPRAPFRIMKIESAQDTRELINYFEQQKKNRLKLVIVVIPKSPVDIYPKVKQTAELHIGILTQCLKDKTMSNIVKNSDRSTAGNILLKINSKLGGVNHSFVPEIKPQCLKVPTIIFGADVTHPSAESAQSPSIAAVAASQSSDVFKYNVVIRLQPSRQEIILQLEEIVYDQLKIFTESNGKKRPEKIFFYRDGVSEGQFPQVMHFELQAIKTACRRFGQPNKYEPKITFLVVQKRHHIRLFPTDLKNSDDKGGNVQAGTIVDTKITHPSHIDFYLVSHASIQGTARPTKYRCLWDDNKMSEDDIETLTYYLCHMFSRCTRSVSYPAPTYYAHLAAFRARALISGVPIQMDNLEREQRTKLTLRPELLNNNPMFFV
ncbi:protein argonaute-2-like [Microplitis mediator]|uniref:protein argonaute-2-like n=1 Tax=Microplitis mediator TaxID=375433 RepID=UPI002552A96A|nr:protein argonaute-2-like [Microplitis mediator]